MRHACLWLLPLVVAGCMGTSSERVESCPRADSEPGVRPGSSAAPPALEPYPPAPLRKDLGEFLVPCERELVRRAMDSVEEVIRLREAGDRANLGRGDHGKSLGCYEARFTLSAPEVVRAEDQAGIARRENLGRTFPALVRLSNSEPKDVSDFRSATTGLAVKVILDPGAYAGGDFLLPGHGEQDFVAGGLRTFVSANIADYADLFQLRIHPYSNALIIHDRHPEAFAVFGTDPLLRYLNPSSAVAPMVLEQAAFSSLVPYAWGDWAVKFRFERCHDFNRDAYSFSRFDSGYQGKVVSQFHQAREICYVMKIQKRPRSPSVGENEAIEQAFPVENAMLEWPGPGAANTPWNAEFREVARLIVSAGTPAMKDDDCENLAFNPWNGLKAHQPLGSLNRARWAVYQRSEWVRKGLARNERAEQK